MSEEISIIRRVISGDVDSFRLLVHRYQKPIISMIRNIINDSHTSEDISQDVFLTAYKKLPSFDPARSKFSTWLFTIARNKSLNTLKRKKSLPLTNPPENTSSYTPCDELTQLKPEYGQNRNAGIFECMDVNHGPGFEALGQGGPDVVLPQHFEHGRAGQTG